MKAKLYIRGAGAGSEPIELEVEEALAAERLIGDATKPKDTPFSIQGVWSGTKADMKFVVFPKKESVGSYQKIEPMTKEEAVLFEKEFEPFKKKAKEEGYRSYNDVLLWLESLGAVALKRSESDGQKHLSPAVHPELYVPSMARFDAYGAYRDKVAYAKQQELKELEKLAAQNAPEIEPELPEIPEDLKPQNATNPD